MDIITVFNSILYEKKRHGTYEAFLYILYNLLNSETIYTKLLNVRKKRLDGLSQNERLTYVAEEYEHVMGRRLDISNPSSFLEYIQWLKIYGITEKMTCLADKLQVREWVKEKIGEEYLVPLLGSWNTYEDIHFEALPNQFCIKANHGSSMNMVVKDKANLNYKILEKNIAAWMNRPFEMVAYEMQYRDIPRRIIAEEYLEGLDGNLFDYKIHCFSGQPVFIQCIGERDVVHHTAYHEHFDLAWNELDWNFECFPRFPYKVKKPECLSEMIDVATKLAEGFTYVRVDLYEIAGKVYFGEMTFTPGSGMYPYKHTWNYERDCELWEQLRQCI